MKYELLFVAKHSDQTLSALLLSAVNCT